MNEDAINDNGVVEERSWHVTLNTRTDDIC